MTTNGENMDFNHPQFLASYGLINQIPNTEKPEIVFSGRSNVGKSSLINKLLTRKAIARVSSMPGKTITINFFDVDKIHLVDLPGYGYAKVAKSEKVRWSKLIEGYFNAERDIALVVQLVDIRHSPSKLDVDMINFLIDSEIPFIIVLTKADKLSTNQAKARIEALNAELDFADGITILPVSAEKGTGIDVLKEIITESIEETETETETEEPEDI